MRLLDLSVRILHEVGAVAVEHAGGARAERDEIRREMNVAAPVGAPGSRVKVSVLVGVLVRVGVGGTAVVGHPCAAGPTHDVPA